MSQSAKPSVSNTLARQKTATISSNLRKNENVKSNSATENNINSTGDPNSLQSDYNRSGTYVVDASSSNGTKNLPHIRSDSRIGQHSAENRSNEPKSNSNVQNLGKLSTKSDGNSKTIGESNTKCKAVFYFKYFCCAVFLVFDIRVNFRATFPRVFAV